MTLEKVAEAIKQYEGWLDAQQSPPHGSRSFRNNNPGNIRFTSWNVTGVHGQDSAGFNIYYSPGEGYNDLLSLLQRRRAEHPDWTIRDLMDSYAPPSENDTNLYAWFIQETIGADSETKLKDLT